MRRLPAGSSARFGALRLAPFRRYWLGSAASVGAFQLLIMGQGWLVYELSGSPLQLGFLGAASSIPTIAAALVGGVIADRVDRRRMLIATSMSIAVLLALLSVLDGSGVVAVWHVLAIAGAIALIVGFDFPSRQAFFPSLITREHMMSAVALNSILWQGSRMFLPALGGVIIALTDTWVIFAAGAAGFIAMSRVMGLYSICFSLIPLGGLLGGVVAAVTSPPFAAALNAGILLAVVVFVATTEPSLRQLDGSASGLAAPDSREPRRGV